jgi:hypothetical protein
MGKKNEIRCDFKSSKKAKRISFKPSELTGYGFRDGRHYSAVTLPKSSASNDRVFARVLTKGPLTLYVHSKTFYVKKDSLVELPIPKGKIVDPIEEGGTKMEKRDKRYVSILNQLLFDCQMSADEAGYFEGDLTRLIRNYNTCRGFPREYIKPKPLYRMNIGALGGYVSSNLSLQESAVVPFSAEHTTFEQSKTAVAGLSLDFSSPRVYDRLFITLEGWYFNSIYLGKDYRGTTFHDVTVEVKSIRVFLGIRYNFLNERSTPFVKAGFAGSIGQDIKVKSIVEQENSVDQVFYSDDLVGFMFEKRVRGFWFSAGYDQLIVGKMKAFAELRYEASDGYFGTPSTSDSQLKNLSVLVGFRF